MAEISRSTRTRRLLGALIAVSVSLVGVLVAPAPAQASVPVATAVSQILADTNALRAAGGLAPLVESTSIDTVAQNWSAQLGASGSFIHNPNYTTQIPAGWTGAAENIASGYTYTTVVEGWHQSAGHYANIMGDYNAIGIGYYDLNGQTYFTEDFGKYASVPSPAPASTANSAGSGSTAPQPVVSGKDIVDSRTGKTWAAHAVNWPSFEYACQQGWGNSADGATTAAAAAMVTWGITAVRIPLNQDCWLGVDGSPKSPITTASYKAALAAWVSILNKAGLVAILDLHWTAPAGSVADGQRAMPDAQSVTFWSQVSAAYKSSPSVLFETFNEAYSRGIYTVSWACWKNGGCQVPSSNDQSAMGNKTYTAHGQAEIVAAIRATGATQPILLDGLNYANDLTGWLANRPSDPQLIASWHNYPGQGCSDTTCWGSQILPVAASVPVIATEFGMTDNDPTFFNTFMTWADAHGIGYAPWAWWATDSSDDAAANLYSLISDLSSFAPRAPEGTNYQQHLASLRPAAPGPSIPVYRFWSQLNQTHFYTASLSERDSIIANYPANVWTYEGVAFQAFLSQVPGTVPLYRFWSPLLSGHFYTASADEKNEIIATYPASTWTYESIAFYVYPADSTVANTLAVSRFWSPKNRHHFYTSSVDEKNSIISRYPSYIWTYEGDTFRVPAS